MIEFSHVYKTYPGPVHALKNIHFSVGAGEFVFVTGPSGAGKTTLFRMLSAFDRPTSGQILVGNFRVDQLRASELPSFRRSIGVVFQDFRLLKNRSIAENVSLPLTVQAKNPLFVHQRVQEVLEQVGLLELQDQLCESLSGGEQQRVAIARALVHQPKILIADEPTGNLDPSRSQEILDLLETLSQGGTTVFVATHDLNSVAARQRRQIRISRGTLEVA